MAIHPAAPLLTLNMLFYLIVAYCDSEWSWGHSYVKAYGDLQKILGGLIIHGSHFSFKKKEKKSLHRLNRQFSRKFRKLRPICKGFSASKTANFTNCCNFCHWDPPLWIFWPKWDPCLRVFGEKVKHLGGTHASTCEYPRGKFSRFSGKNIFRYG